MSGLRLWFAGRSLRERRLILVMLALLAVTLVWAGILLPVTDGLASARTRHADAVLRLAETQARVAAIRAVPRAAPLGQPLDAEVRARADAAGFTVASLAPQGSDRVQLSITQARPGALFAWIAGLEEAGILVETMAITNNGDQTVSLQLTLRSQA
ncbi:type II secretion system protein GspM [Sphingomonas aracearum]|uniref:Type II secretion system protein M n=1 Tax=Sphingomonas aracearum TaxID=2283317 RepID=A0A369VRY3_9SPHN|nr:type II secretion system protein GspM [Sphingomonas aracearum]RDE05148.1 type II secretion system protein M [Sphingomonas aracearum]